MPYNESLADRVRQFFSHRHVVSVEKKMMGGLCFMVSGKMCLGITQDSLMVRLDPSEYEMALNRPGCREMNFTGRPMRGFVFVDAEGWDDQVQFSWWIDRALAYNPRAPISSKKKRSSNE